MKLNFGLTTNLEVVQLAVFFEPREGALDRATLPVKPLPTSSRTGDSTEPPVLISRYEVKTQEARMSVRQADFKVGNRRRMSKSALAIALSLLVKNLVEQEMENFVTREELREAGVLTEKEDTIEK